MDCEAIDHELQIVLFSATMPSPILRIAKNYQKSPEMVEIEARNLGTAPGISQKYFNIADRNSSKRCPALSTCTSRSVL